jgi:hypothetical protein
LETKEVVVYVKILSGDKLLKNITSDPVKKRRGVTQGRVKTRGKGVTREA